MVSQSKKLTKVHVSTVPGPQPTPKVGRQPPIRVVARDEVVQRSGANLTASNAAPVVEEQVASVEALHGDAPTRQEEIKQLPTFGEVTGLSTEEECKTLLVVPMRSLDAVKDCYWDESATKVQVAACVRRISKRVDELVTEAGDDLSLEEISPDGRPEVEAQRAGHFKNAANGITKIRVQAEFYEYLQNILEEEFIVVPDDQSTLEEEVYAGAEFYPAAVIEQIAVQNAGMKAWARYDRSSGTYAYQFSYTSEAQRRLADRRGYLVQLGSYEKLVPSRVAKRIQMEEITAYGFTGVGSAIDFGRTPIAGAMALSSDLVRMMPARGVKAGMGAVVTIRFPYSTANYHKVLNLLAQAHFKLPIGEHVLEITLATNPVELAKLLRLNLLAEEVDEVEEKEAPRALDLRIAEGAVAGELVAACLWDLRREVGREAAALARAWRMRAEGWPEAHTHEMHNCAMQTLGECVTARDSCLDDAMQMEVSGELTDPSQINGDASCGAGIIGSRDWHGILSATWARIVARVAARRYLVEAGASAGAAWGLLREWLGCVGEAAGSVARRGCAARSQGWTRWRPQEHLLGWGFDARGCSGRRK